MQVHVGRRISKAPALWVGLLALVFALRPHPPVDLAVYLQAGQRFLAGGGLYGPGWGAALDHPLPYTYPPLWAAAVSVVSWAPWRLVTGVWALVNAVLFVWIAQVSFDRFLATRGEARSRTLALLACAGMCAAPIAATLWLGQVGVVLTAAILADTLPRTQRLPRGILVGAATAVKLTPGLFVIYWALTGRLREAGRAAATAVGLTLAVAVLRPGLSRSFWTSVVFDTSRVGNPADVVNQSVRGLLLRIDAPSVALWLVCGAVLAGVGLQRARRAHRNGDELAAVTLVGLTGLALSPISWIHHGVWIVPAIGVVLGSGESRARVRAAIALAVVFVLRLPDWTVDLSLTGPFALVFGNADVLAYFALILLLPVGRPVPRDEDPPDLATRVAPARPRQPSRCPRPGAKLVLPILIGQEQVQDYSRGHTSNVNLR